LGVRFGACLKWSARIYKAGAASETTHPEEARRARAWLARLPSVHD
jgi:hypothetical protein